MIVATPIGKLQLVISDARLVYVRFLPPQQVSVVKPEKLLKQVIEQLDAYFIGQRQQFSLPLSYSGTPFQEKVWRALAQIPYGETRTYQALAQELGTSARAIGNACRMNPLPIVIPCHRVVAKAGLGGFSGETKGQLLNIKRFLLDLEQRHL